jgi:hypothetical protein
MVLRDICTTTPIKCLMGICGIILLMATLAITRGIEDDRALIVVDCNATMVTPPCCITKKKNDIEHCHYITTGVVTMFSLAFMINTCLMILIIIVCPPPKKNKYNEPNVAI